MDILKNKIRVNIQFLILQMKSKKYLKSPVEWERTLDGIKNKIETNGCKKR